MKSAKPYLPTNVQRVNYLSNYTFGKEPNLIEYGFNLATLKGIQDFLADRHGIFGGGKVDISPVRKRTPGTVRKKTPVKSKSTQTYDPHKPFITGTKSTQTYNLSKSPIKKKQSLQSTPKKRSIPKPTYQGIDAFDLDLKTIPMDISPPRKMSPLKSLSDVNPSMISATDILFRGKKEIMDIMESSGNIIEYMTDFKNPICPLIGAEITLVQPSLGKGVAGEVFAISFDNRGVSQYVVKRVNANIQEFTTIKKDIGKTYKELRLSDADFIEGIKKSERDYNFLDLDAILKYNNVDPDYKIRKRGEVLLVPYFMSKVCSSKKMYARTDDNGYTFIPKGSIICDNKFTELLISIMAGELYRRNISINFIDIFYFATCLGDQKTDINHYTFMQKITSSLKKTPIESYNSLNFITIQILHAIATYQQYFKIVHGDLHRDNVFLQLITPDIEWNGQKLVDANYFEYIIGKSSLYIPYTEKTKYIVKIGDWGLAAKYDGTIVADRQTMESGYDQGDGAWLPNYYDQVYDMIFIVDALWRMQPDNEFIKNIYMHLIGATVENLPDVETVAPIGIRLDELFTARRDIFSRKNAGLRPDLKEISKLKDTAKGILLNKELMEIYSVPQKGNGIILGTI